LAGLIGASGIARRPSADLFEIAWQHYRVSPASRQQPQSANWGNRNRIAKYESTVQGNSFHDTRSIKCVAVWDTVGSYGIPAGFGLAPLARYVALIFLGFHDTSFGEHIDVGLHAIAVDEHRRPFVPTFWTIEKGRQPRGHVEQTWFAGAHRNVGGGYPDSGLSDLALIWMIARVGALTGLEFDVSSVRSNTKPNIGGAVVDSTKGWFLDEHWPHYRAILSPQAIHHGYLFNSAVSDEQNINERVHWSVLAKRESGATPRYDPPNLPRQIPPEKIAAMTDEEQDLLQREKRLDVPSAQSGE
jgi:type VI secretion system (T6SS) phospholipase Tle1-like effector